MIHSILKYLVGSLDLKYSNVRLIKLHHHNVGVNVQSKYDQSTNSYIPPWGSRFTHWHRVIYT